MLRNSEHVLARFSAPRKAATDRKRIEVAERK